MLLILLGLVARVTKRRDAQNADNIKATCVPFSFSRTLLNVAWHYACLVLQTVYINKNVSNMQISTTAILHAVTIFSILRKWTKRYKILNYGLMRCDAV